ncbi:outer membrane beta-barrel protein [Solemya velum gill symbiont]|uniref:outer membrane beta-barrel protein n=1 Tax=Solemya velum gill symbiont TaxID=2340 RepID=UPI0015C34117|nr:outer membrane beta-barrel protein [Solemya velum gill symbiont]
MAKKLYKAMRGDRVRVTRLKLGAGALILCAGAFGSSSVLSQYRLEKPVRNMVAYPILNISAGYSSALYDSSGDEKAASPTIAVMLGAGLQGKRRGHFYGLEYVAETNYFTDTEAEEQQVNQRFVGYWGTAFTQRQNLDIGFEIRDQELPRGYENPLDGNHNTIGDPSGANWKQYQAGALYVLGNDETRGKLELAACLTCIRNDDDDYDYRDSNIIDASATLLARVLPKTHLLFQVAHSNFEYTNANTSDFTDGLDSTETRYLVGATWRATRKTTGTAKIGYVVKDFESGSSREGHDNLILDLAVDWNPNKYNAVRLHYMYRPFESVEYDDLVQDDYVEINQVDLTWSKAWSPRLFSNTSAYYGQDEYNVSGRADERYGAELGLRYKTNRYGSIGVTLFSENRTSSLAGHGYEDQGIMIDYNIGQLFGFGEQINSEARAADICKIR